MFFKVEVSKPSQHPTKRPWRARVEKHNFRVAASGRTRREAVKKAKSRHRYLKKNAKQWALDEELKESKELTKNTESLLSGEVNNVLSIYDT